MLSGRVSRVTAPEAFLFFMITDIHYCSRLSAEERLTRENPARTAVISITDPGQAPALIHWDGPILRLSFWDGGSTEELGLAPNAVAQVVQFLEHLDAKKEPYVLVVHCEYGASRSPAVALYAEALTGADLHRRYLAFGANRYVLEALIRARHLAEAVHVPEGPGAMTLHQ